MTTYFGEQTNTGDDVAGGGYTIWIGPYSCPGSGIQNIQELSALMGASVAGNIRLAVYNSDASALIAEGVSEVAAVANGWSGHLSQSAVKAAGGVSPGQLTGGVNYILSISFDGNCDSLTGSGTLNYGASDYTGGFASSLVSDGTFGEEYCIRCGVDAAVGSSIVPLLLNQYRARRV